MTNLQLADEIIENCKEKISKTQKKIKYYETMGKAGMCLNLTGKIQAYNEIISEINKRTR